MTDLYQLQRGTSPLLISMPHVGTEIPEDQRHRYTARALQVEDTDWFLDRLYAFAADMGASLLVPRYSRYLIDLNRPSDNQPMYPGVNNTELCPTRHFTGEPIYRDGQAPDEAEIQRRVATYWQPYHDALRRTGAPARPARPRVLFDAHSIKSELPWLFEGTLPHMNLGTVTARAAHRRCATHWPPCWRRRAATAMCGRPLQGRPHHAPLRPPGRRRARGAAGDVLARLHGRRPALCAGTTTTRPR
jgi:N-formylglutamate deformylase